MIDWTKIITPEAQLQAAKEAALEQVRLRRDRAIATGIGVAGIPVPTDEKTQGRIMGAAVAAMLDPAYEVLWKADDGVFVRLSSAEVIGIASQVRAHVQACFDREAELRQAIAEDEAPNTELGWPGQRVIRLHPDRVEEPGEPFGVTVEHSDTGIYRLSGHPDLAKAAGDIPAPRDADGQPIADITATWADGALVIWVSANGELTDIPANRWITINL
ncbi:DUF4376 domain-containing protein [Thioclava sp.]|uniref:DUF4376 domain-containing protein n=1 Tax=Thioclava sp. TaxID=1933450 RepID=UPI00324200BE